MGYGLKGVSRRREDALARTDWQRVEHLLAAHYRQQGYDVEHTGTANTRCRFDGGIDLKLRRANEYIVVQVKHWNAYKVPHNEIHQLLGIMVNQRATGAIFITSGEFTKAAIEAATRHGHVVLVDGDELRQMLGPLPGAPDARADASRRFIDVASDRLLTAAADRIRYGGRGPGRTVQVGLWLVVAKIGLSVLLLLIAITFFQTFLRTATAGLGTASAPAARVAPIVRPAPPPVAVEVLRQPASRAQPIQDPCREVIDARGSYIDRCAGKSSAQTDDERRQAEETARILRDSTKEMPDPLPGSPSATN
jgi:hypothetical protein